MNDSPRDKYEILDLFFSVLTTLCIISTAVFLLSNLIVSVIYIVIVVFFAFLSLNFWRCRNPFNVYLVRAFALNNFLFTFIALIVSYSISSSSTPEFPYGYVLLLVPSVFYLIISFKFSAISFPPDKKTGAMLAYTGRSKAAQQRFFKDDPEERIQREQLIVKQKKEHRYNLIIILIVALTLGSFVALGLGFY